MSPPAISATGASATGSRGPATERNAEIAVPTPSAARHPAMAKGNTCGPMRE